jgi:NhaA family Na+:H+ antiporter
MADNQPGRSRLLGQAIRRFMELESAGGIVLLGATVLALVWANSPFDTGYRALWDTPVTVNLGPLHFDEDFRAMVNDGLMAVFFFVVGLEIKREVVTGELRDPRAVGLPVVAAVGGMLVPAAIYAALNAGGSGSPGWGIPMATDIAFALGVAVLLGDRIPGSLRVFLLTLAIADDVGAILVIAVFYNAGLSWGWLGLALAGLALTRGLRQLGMWSVPVYTVIGAGVWFAMHSSGVHATIAGVALGLLTPALPREGGAVPVAERLENALHPWTSFGVVPVFALANAGVAVSAGTLGDALSSSVGLGIVAGLVAGKTVGITAGSWAAVRLRLGRLPEGVAWRQLVSVAALAGIGFTVSLFVAGLAFDDAAHRETATLAVLVASVLAALLGAGLAAAVSRAGRGSCR